MATVEFHGQDLVVKFRQNVGTAADHYTIEYKCGTSTVTHTIDQAAFASEDANGQRHYIDTLLFKENQAAGLTRTPTVTLRAYAANGDTAAVVEYAQNSIPVLPSAPSITPTVDGVQVDLKQPDDGDVAGYRAYVGAYSNFTISDATLRVDTASTSFQLPLGDTIEHWLIVVPYDAFGFDPASACQPIPIVRAGLVSLPEFNDVTQTVAGLQNESDTLVSTAQGLVDRTRQQQLTTLAAQLLAEERKTLSNSQAFLNGIPVGAQVKRVEQQQVDGDTALAQSIEQVSASVDIVDGRITSEVTRLDRTIVDGDTAQATSLQSTKAELAGSIAGVDNRVSAEVARLDTAIVTADQAQASALQTTKAELEGGIAGVDGRVTSEVTRLDSAVSTVSEAQATALQTTKAELEGGIAGVDNRVTSEVTRLDNAVATGDKVQADALQSTKAELEGAIGGVDSRVTSEISRLDTAISTADQAQASALQSTKAELQRNIDGVNSTVSSEVTRLDSAISTVDQSQATALQTVKADLGDRVTSEVTRLDQAISTQSGTLNSSLTQLKSTVDGNTASVDLLFETVNGEQATAQLGVTIQDNGVAEITGVKINGQQRSIVFTADKLVVGTGSIFQVDTTTGVVSASDLLVGRLRASSVITDSIAANAVNNVLIAVDGAHTPPASDGSYSSPGATITSTGGVIRIDYGVAMSKTNNAGIAYCQLQRDMNGQTTVFGSSQYNAGLGGQAGVGQFSGFTLDTIPAGSTARYYFYYGYNTYAGPVVWNYEQILLTEIKR